MASYTADSIIKECRDFVNLKESNYLYSSFVERLEELASAKDGVLTEKQREAYTRQNNVYIKKYIFPAYEQLISGLSEVPAKTITGCAIFRMAGLTTNIW